MKIISRAAKSEILQIEEEKNSEAGEDAKAGCTVKVKSNEKPMPIYELEVAGNEIFQEQDIVSRGEIKAVSA